MSLANASDAAIPLLVVDLSSMGLPPMFGRVAGLGGIGPQRILAARQFFQPLTDFIFPPADFAIPKFTRPRNSAVAAHTKEGGAADTEKFLRLPSS